MLTRRDQLQSYQFLMQRVISAFSMRDTDPLTPPFRRFVIAGACSVVLAFLIMAGAGIYGVINPGGSESWRAGDKVIVERETGAQYVFQEGKLLRVANYASGVLLLGKDNGSVDVARASLLGVPRGPEVGIDGAPNGLPPADQLLGAPWTLCSKIVRDESDSELATTVLLVGDRAAGGSAVGDGAVLVDDIEANTLYLLVNGYRHKITDETAALSGLGLADEPRVRVGTAWVNAVPAGVDLAPLPLGSRGQPSAFPGALVGQLLVSKAAGGVDQHYVAVVDGLRPITEVQFALLLASPQTEQAYPEGVALRAREIQPAEAAQATVERKQPSGPEQLPRTPPRMASAASPNATVCGTFGDEKTPPAFALDADLPVSQSDLVTARRTNEGTLIADRVLIAPGRGALVEAVQGRDAKGVIHLVTEQGVRYPLAGPELVQTFGYQPGDVVRLPAALVARVAEGAALDPEKAGTVLLQR